MVKQIKINKSTGKLKTPSRTNQAMRQPITTKLIQRTAITPYRMDRWSESESCEAFAVNTKKKYKKKSPQIKQNNKTFVESMKV